MGLFDIFKNKEPQPEHKGSVLISMPMFNNGDAYKLDNVIANLKDHWGVTVTEVEGDDTSAAFKVDGELVALAYIPLQIPWDDIKGTSQYAYNWTTAESDLANHNGHAIVSVMSSTKTTIERFKILSKLLYSILTTSNAIGVYQGSQSLLIPKTQYLDYVSVLKQGKIPVLAWIYIGIRKSETTNSAYTYGLIGFQKQEMEVIDSQMNLEDLHTFLTNIASYVIGSNVTFKTGETLGYTADQKIKIASSKGQFVEGQSLKLQL